MVATDTNVVPAVPGYWAYHPLSAEQVRWYYLRTPLSLKGVYEQDILHRAHIQRFCTSDSNRLESAFQAQRDELEKAWWEEQAELGARTAPAPKSGSTPSIPEAEDASVGWQDYFLGHAAENEVGHLVRSRLYEVNLRQRRIKACYWPEPSHRVLRGTWFVEKAPDWVPLKETTADELEEAYHSEVWNPSKGKYQHQQVGQIQAARIDLLTLNNEAKGWFALFVNESEVFLCKDDSLSWLSRRLSAGGGAPGMRLRRGYQAPPEGVNVQEADLKAEEADEAMFSQPISKLLLVVHGIGQNLNGSNIAGDAAAIRQNLCGLANEQLSEKEKAAGRIEVLPVQWRKHLNLDVDSMADVLMPPGVRSLRMMLHSTAVEVLLYLTPLHCQDMLDSLVDSLNIQFHKFQRRNPSFQGEVSILAHSLGSVLCYDILCSQPHLFAAIRKDDNVTTPPTSAKDAWNCNGEDQHAEPQQSNNIVPFDASQAGTEKQDGSSVISADLIDLQPLVASSRSASHLSSELEALRQENARLHSELDRLRANSGQEASTTGRGALQSFGSGAIIPQVTIKPLAFAVDRFIAAGSPLGIFLTLRRLNPSKGRGLGTPEAAQLMLGSASIRGDGLPAVHRMYNLYHPFDPVGFRLEPLITAGAEKRRPVYAAYYKGGRRLHVGLAEFGEDMSAAMSAGAARATSILQHSLKLVSLSKKGSEAKEAPTVESKLTAEEEADERGVHKASQGTESAIWRLTEGQGDALDSVSSSRSAKGRLDFVLQTGNVENPWLSAMSSHFAYWANFDVALFILRALHHQDVRVGAPKDPAPKGAGKPAADGTSPPEDEASLPTSPLSSIKSPMLSPRSSGIRTPSRSIPRGQSDPEDWW